MFQKCRSGGATSHRPRVPGETLVDCGLISTKKLSTFVTVAYGRQCCPLLVCKGNWSKMLTKEFLLACVT